MTKEDAAIARRLREAFQADYQDRLVRVLLYGSRARGDHREDSDFDIVVVLDRIEDRWAESRRVRDIIDRTLDLPVASLISAIPTTEDAIAQRTPLMHDVRREGILL